LCRDSDLERVRARNALLQSFEDRSLDEFTVRADPAVSKELSRRMLEEVLSPDIHFLVFFGGTPWTDMEPPTVYVYRDTEQLHRFSCVNAGADAYYDGAIHISAVLRDGNWRGALEHELVHHALRSRGIFTPMWLHEGLAMYVAGEAWVWRPQFALVRWARTEHLPFAAMTGAFPDGADAQFARIAYFQSLMMLFAIIDGPSSGSDSTCSETGCSTWIRVNEMGITRVRALIEGIGSGEVTPEGAFSWASERTQERGPEAAWDAAVARLPLPPASPESP
jgi:hypothetical protein